MFQSLKYFLSNDIFDKDETETVDEGVNIDADKVAWILRSLADTAEQFHR